MKLQICKYFYNRKVTLILKVNSSIDCNNMNWVETSIFKIQRQKFVIILDNKYWILHLCIIKVDIYVFFSLLNPK